MAAAIDRPLERTPPVRPSGRYRPLERTPGLSLLFLSAYSPPNTMGPRKSSIELHPWETELACRPSMRCIVYPTVNGFALIVTQPNSLACGGSSR